jgi:hypothetical protein
VEGTRDVCRDCDLGSGRASSEIGAVISGSAFTTAGWEFFWQSFTMVRRQVFGGRLHHGWVDGSPLYFLVVEIEYPQAYR